jgi:hypothetical protein
MDKREWLIPLMFSFGITVSGFYARISAMQLDQDAFNL